jgi:hypothetical protein
MKTESHFLFLFMPLPFRHRVIFDSKRLTKKIPFQLINNLVFIPINVNGVELTFLLDSGVKETILFSLEEKNEISLKNIEKSLSGLGSEDAIEGLKSAGIYSRWRDGIYQSPLYYC